MGCKWCIRAGWGQRPTTELLPHFKFTPLWLVVVGWRIHKFVISCNVGFFFLLFLRAVPAAYGSSHVRGRIRAAATGLRHSHSNSGSQWLLRPTLKLEVLSDPLTHWARPGMKFASSCVLVGFLTPWATMVTPSCNVLKKNWASGFLCEMFCFINIGLTS